MPAARSAPACAIWRVPPAVEHHTMRSFFTRPILGQNAVRPSVAPAPADGA